MEIETIIKLCAVGLVGIWITSLIVFFALLTYDMLKEQDKDYD